MGKWSQEDVEQKLIQEVATILVVEPATITPDAPLHTLGVDSISFVELLVFIEKTFGLALIDAGLTRKDFETLRALARCISEKT